MGQRSCPFCGSNSGQYLGVRTDIWARCRNCRSVFRDITPARFQQIHAEAFQDHAFLDASTALAGAEPLNALWTDLDLRGPAVLEIGPGSGQLLAAARDAGCSVAAVESSGVHRDYIRDTWQIDQVYTTMEQIPAGHVFDTIVAINMFEHVYDITGFIRSVSKLLAPGGTFFISTPNATSLEATLLKTWWTMCKVHDHVSFPSSGGLRTAAQASGLRVQRIWSTGLPFELPVSALTAARDRYRLHRGPDGSVSSEADRSSPHARNVTAQVVATDTKAKSALARFYATAAPFDPVYRLLGAWGRAGSLKARLIR